MTAPSRFPRAARAFDAWTSDAPLFNPRITRWANGVALVLAAVVLYAITQRTRMTPIPPPLPVETSDGNKFGLPLNERLRIFRDIASIEKESREKAKERFSEAWRVEDDRAANERDRVRSIAGKRGISVTVAYLVLDEGIRSHWLTPDGSQLDPQVVPLQTK